MARIRIYREELAEFHPVRYQIDKIRIPKESQKQEIENVSGTV
jgi:hypothetical protein